MTKTKRQLRAEAVERLKRELDDELVAKGYKAKAEIPLKELIDLLTDEEPPEGDALELLRDYSEKMRYDYDEEHDVFEPDERLFELCGHVADMMERDYVLRCTYDAMCQDCDRLQDRLDDCRRERDEWKAKAETCNPCGWWHSGLQFCENPQIDDTLKHPRIRKGLGYKDRPPHEKTEASKAFEAELDAELGEQDTREKLRYDASELTVDYAASGEVCDTLYYGILGLLDRQAAIAEREQAVQWLWKVEKLQDEVDELLAKHATVYAERDNLARDLGECMAERDIMRGKLDAIAAAMGGGA